MPNPFTIGNFQKYDYPDQLRTVFGDNKTYIDPYTTGYHFMFFFLPNKLAAKYGKFLTTVCQSATVPGLTVNPIEYKGLNGLNWSVPGTVEYDSNRVTCKFIEMAGLPILQISGSWVNIFRNIHYGIADPETGGVSQSDYKGRMLYATTLADGKTIQFAATFTGVYPLKVPTDLFSSDRQSQDKVEPEIEFWFDLMYMGENVLNSAKNMVEATMTSSISSIDQMYSEASGSFK